MDREKSRAKALALSKGNPDLIVIEFWIGQRSYDACLDIDYLGEEEYIVGKYLNGYLSAG
jgi:hypothetical protein